MIKIFCDFCKKEISDEDPVCVAATSEAFANGTIEMHWHRDCAVKFFGENALAKTAPVITPKKNKAKKAVADKPVIDKSVTETTTEKYDIFSE